jgi:hypothetical protein
MSRRWNVYKSFQELRDNLRKLKVKDAIIDGELVCLDSEGRSVFEELPYRRTCPVFYAFDVLYLNGRDLRQLPLLERKEKLKALVEESGLRDVVGGKYIERYEIALQLSVHFDKQSANVGEIVQCSVDAERIGFRGYGMLLAEIGLPPGAEVDRSSLERAMKASGWDINEYDVLPDKLIVYLWPHAGGTKFSFTFKPRYGLKALSAPSILYDYL